MTTSDTNPDAASATQGEMSAAMDAIAREYEIVGVVETQPRLDYPPYRSSLLRHPTKDLQPADPEGIELWAPCFGQRDVAPARGRPDPAARR